MGDGPLPPGWARLSSGVIHDPAWLQGSASARLVFLTSIALAKAAKADGVISLRAMIGIQYGALEPAEVEAAAVELVEAGLWIEGDEPGLYEVRSFLKWNLSTAEVKEAKHRKRVGAHRTNHGRGLHEGHPVDDCPDCHPDVSPSGSASSAIAPAVAHASGSASAALDKTETETRPDQTRQDQTNEESNIPELSTTVMVATDGGDEIASDTETANLVELLAETITAYADQAGHNWPEVKITRQWFRDMDLLRRRGPTDGKPEAIEPARIERVIRAIPERLGNPEPGSGFCWADQIRSPGKLRKHWTPITTALNRGRTNGRYTSPDQLDQADELLARLKQEGAL